ncbi:MAG: hypothetical protein ACLP5V_16175 [Candidatus Bathyarchaeia archaeon]
MDKDLKHRRTEDEDPSRRVGANILREEIEPEVRVQEICNRILDRLNDNPTPRRAKGENGRWTGGRKDG